MRLPVILSASKLPNWNLRIQELSFHGKWEEVFSHFHGMNKAGVRLTDPSVFPSIMKACSSLSFYHGKCVHVSLIKQGFESFVSIGNSTMDFYMKYGDLGSALSVFDRMRNRDSVSWNVLIHGCVDMGGFGDGLRWFMEARVDGFEPNISTLVLVIHGCRVLRDTGEGLKLHGYVIRSGFWGSYSVRNSLLGLYADQDMGCAQKLFDEMLDRDVISWSVMIGGYVLSEKPWTAMKCFREMVSKAMIEPDGVTMVSVLKACSNLRDISIGKLVQAFVICRGLDLDLFVGNCLIDMYSKCNAVDSAFNVFNEMPPRNVVSWNSMLSGFVLNGKYLEALSLFYSMGKEGIEADEVALVNSLQICKFFVHPLQCKSVHCVITRRKHDSNELLLNSLIDTYAKCNLIELALKLFNGMNRRDVVSWSTMIAGFAHCGMPDEAMTVFQEMSQEQMKPNAVCVINLLEVCSLSAELKRSKWAHGIAIRRGFGAEVAVGTAILDMYSKCGAIDFSRKAFNQITQKNIVSWSAMISAYGMNGLAHEALSLIAEMKKEGLKPNAVTILSLLSACSHGGLIEEGLSFFKTAVQEYGIEPVLEHYSCIVDMLGRAGKLDSALDLINMMPKGIKAGASIWGAFLSACRNYGNSELGAKAVSHVLELEPLNSAGYLLASSLYATGGLWSDALNMRRLVKAKEVRVVAGYSLVHVDNKRVRFVAGDESDPRTAEIYVTVEELHSCMRIKHFSNIEC